MSEIKINKVTESYIGDHGIMFAKSYVGVGTSVPQDVGAAFKALRQSAGSSPGTKTEEELASLERELQAESPSRKNILSRIRGVVEVAETTGAIGRAADALSKAVEAWL